MKNSEYDVVVVGAGHAGIEAAIVSAKMGQNTLLVTNLVDNIGAVSCNPAIGGLGKGHLVKDIDALGGVMGKITDKAAIQFRRLNESKGPAVRGSRSQIDMDRYKIYAKEECFNTENLCILQDSVESILIENGAAVGVKGKLKNYHAKKVILTTGTFLNAVVHIGEIKIDNGRFGEPSSKNLGNNLEDIGFEVGRLKTGTCPRIDGKSIDFTKMERHGSDEHIVFFSKDTTSRNLEDRACYITYTNKYTHKIIEDNFDRAPLFIGQIEGVGPRYCPSIEDKINRFRDKERHQLFLEPQTLEAKEYYLNGMSTSLPIDVQEEMIRSVSGLENAIITRYGYAIEYDYVNPTALKETLETKLVDSLYFAGQINGTTGYEEAAAQGLHAGINASLKLLNRDEFILNRNESYIGVMINDLVTKGTKEPYRMFTSRAEYRLLLREDNADLRLSRIGYKLGIKSKSEAESISKKEKNIAEAMRYMRSKYITPNKEFLLFLESIGEDKISDKTSIISLMSRKSFDDSKLVATIAYFEKEISIKLSEEEREQVLIECKYSNYIKKQKEQIDGMEELLSMKIPENMDFYSMSGISTEIAEKLSLHRPTTLYNALGISGVTPAAIEVLEIYIKKYSR